MKAAPQHKRAHVVAARLALGYAALCITYILVSSRVAALLATDKETLESVEQVKGVAFVLVSSLLFFLFARSALARTEQREQELLRNAEALVKAERHALAGIMAASFAHDLNNALAVATVGLEDLAEAARTDPRRSDVARQVGRAISEASALSRRIMTFGRQEESAGWERVGLLDTLRRAADLARVHHLVRSCRIEVEGDADLVVTGQPQMLGQVALNLLLNAAEATNGHARIEVRVRRAEGGGGIVEFDDDGPGIPDAVRERLFHPFTTTKPNGTGLGLLSVQAAARQHGGEVACSPSPLGGARFTLTFPPAAS